MSKWQEMENNHKPLLTKLADIFPENLPDGTDSVALKDVWNYYDPIHVARTECNENEGGSPDSYGCQELVDIPELHNVLTEQEFLDLEALVEQTEQMKFGTSTAKNLLGSNLLWKMLNRTSIEGRFFLYSAHAPTIMGFLSTIKEWTLGEKFPDYGSAVIMEVYEDSFNTYSVRFLYKPASNPIPFPMKIPEIGCNEMHEDPDTLVTMERCAVDKLMAWAKDNTYTTEKDWCQACGNEVADVCLTEFKNAWSIFEERTSTTEPQLLASVFFGGFFSGLFFMFLCCLCSKKDPPKQYSTDPDDDDLFEDAIVDELDESQSDGSDNSVHSFT